MKIPGAATTKLANWLLKRGRLFWSASGQTQGQGDDADGMEVTLGADDVLARTHHKKTEHERGKGVRRRLDVDNPWPQWMMAVAR